ncbi:MAG: hypothetical protein JJ934_08360 [Pseudomonadales bacterium]|nr:hypothetical protein [Pseudomonadales bacterium]
MLVRLIVYAYLFFWVSMTNASIVVLDQISILESPTEQGLEHWRVDRDSLPIIWQPGEFSDGHGWYRLPIADSQIPDKLAGVLMPRVYLTADVYLNDLLIGSAGASLDEPPRNINTPLYFTIPQNAWKKTGNFLTIHHRSYPGAGHLMRLELGDDATLRERYRELYFWHQHAPRALYVLELFCVLFGLGMWSIRRNDTYFGWFAGAMFSLSLLTLNQFMAEPPMGHKWWLAISNTGIDAWIVFLIMFSHRSVGYKNRGLELFALGNATLAFFYYVTLDEAQLVETYVFHTVSFALSLFCVFWFSWLRIAHQLPTLATSFLFLVIFLVAAHDFGLQVSLADEGWEDRRFVLFYVGPLCCLLMFAKIVLDFNRAKMTADNHAAALSDEVARVTSELEAQHKEMEVVMADRATALERDRIYRDLHDDMGARLLSVYYDASEANNPSLAEKARSAINELRAIVTRRAMSGETLLDAMEVWRIECEERCDAAGIAFSWCNGVGEVAEVWLDEIQFSYLARMLRELLTNTLKHCPNATAVNVEVHLKDGYLGIDFRNDGVETPTAQWQKGIGLNSMQARVTELGGEVSRTDVSPEGCLTNIRLPVHRDAVLGN